MQSHSEGSRLPIEVWRAIFEQVLNQRDLAALMRVCSSFTPHAKAFLYRAIVLQSPTQAKLLFNILRRFPELALTVKWLTINVVTMWDEFRIPLFIPSLFETLINVRHFSLGFFVSPPEPGTAAGGLLRMDPRWFPRLRTFATELPIASDIHMDRFLKGHPKLQELHVSPSNAAHVMGLPEYTAPAVPFPSLRALSCRPFLLMHTISGAINLTHLHLPYCNESSLYSVAEMLGSQLVSLRLSKVRFVGEPWSSAALLVKLSVLRFLQVDMEPERGVYVSNDSTPYLATKPFDWYRAPDTLPREPRAHQLRVVWAYLEEGDPETQAKSSAWREFLYWTSLEVLKTWSAFFSTIEFRHPVLWGVSVTLGTDGVEVAQVPKEEVRRDSWMYA
ncbi:hypothetical protein L227DRAFT_566902 [Lentinus tigrinus ALCF2SS1-6]|uniref:Uncharacterized protein n=2 Tax=Lentinus tigrinus TaxID=5365 RepID=A0A5C2RWV1_9APHY|nr:hypothetical protein L227DRAFT_566902 [Lentinus tigrinus ALCF2SS1-6]